MPEQRLHFENIVLNFMKLAGVVIMYEIDRIIFILNLQYMISFHFMEIQKKGCGNFLLNVCRCDFDELLSWRFG